MASVSNTTTTVRRLDAHAQQGAVRTRLLTFRAALNDRGCGSSPCMCDTIMEFARAAYLLGALEEREGKVGRFPLPPDFLWVHEPNL